jgi:hypothetical protein
LAGAGAGGGPSAGPAPVPIPSKGWELDGTWAPTTENRSCPNEFLQAAQDFGRAYVFPASELMAIALVHSFDQRSVMIGMKEVCMSERLELVCNGCVKLDWRVVRSGDSAALPLPCFCTSSGFTLMGPAATR